QPIVNRIGGRKGACHAGPGFKRSVDRKLKGSRPAALDRGEKLSPTCGISLLRLLREMLERVRPALFEIDGGRINTDRGIMTINCYGAGICIAASARLETNWNSGLLVGKNRLDPNPVADLLDEFVFICCAAVDNDASQTYRLIC